MTYADRGVMFGAPLVLHGQDQGGKSPFIGSVFSVGSFHHRSDAKSMGPTLPGCLCIFRHLTDFVHVSCRSSGTISTARASWSGI